MGEPKIFSVFIFIDDGRCLFNQSFTVLAPPTSLITGLLTAVQLFVQEITGENSEILSAGGFVFHMQKFGPITIALTTSDNTRPSEFLEQIGIRFMQRYGSVDKWKGRISDFLSFEEDIGDILGKSRIIKRIDPRNPLSSLVLMQVDNKLQPVAQAILQLRKGYPQDIMKISKTKEFVTRKHLEKLVQLGHIGRLEQQGDFYYFTH